MKHTKRGLSFLVAVATLVGAAAPLLAVDDEEDMVFTVDPIVIETIQTDVDTNSAKFQEYRDLSSGFRLPSMKIFGVSGDGDRTFTFFGTNLDRRDARYTLDYGVAGHYGLNVDYNKIPHRFGNDAAFLWTQTGPGRLEIPDPIQASFQNALEAQFPAIDSDFLSGLITPFLDGASRIDLALQRDRTHARLDVHKMDRLGWAVDVRHESRAGNRPYAGSFGFSNVLEIFEPIDYETTDIELSGALNADRGGLRFGYRHSVFENERSTLVWDNPWRVTDSTDSRAYLGPGGASINGSSIGFADLAPDNDAGTLFVDGKLKLDSGWSFSGSASYGIMKQDDPLLPFTLNTSIVGIDPESLASFNPTSLTGPYIPGNADTEVQTTSFYGRASKDLSEDLELTLRYRYYDYDNRSARLELPGYVRFHSVWEEIPRITVPYEYSRDDLGIELDWTVSDSTDLEFSYHVKSMQREFREIDDSDEDVFEIALNTRPNPKVHLRAGWQMGDRTIDEYRTDAQELSFLHPEGINNQPGLRKFDEAARDFDDYSLQLMLYPTDTVNIILGTSSRDEDFSESLFGLVSDEIDRFNWEVSYNPSAAFSFFVFGDMSERDSFQRARQSGGTLSTSSLDDWSVLLAETNDTYGLGLTADSSDRVHWDVSVNWSNSDGDADFETPAGGSPSSAVDFDNYEDIELLAMTLKLDFDLSERASVGFTYLYEDYTINSFNLVGLQPYLPASILLAASNGDYQADIWGLRLKLKI